jgi:hypothetical protein
MYRKLWAGLAAVTAAILLTLGGGVAAEAATPVQITLPALDATAANPNGLALDALNWGGVGNSSTCTTGDGVSNSPVGVWRAAGAGCASDWVILADATPGTYQIQYQPDGNASANLCVSTIGNSVGVHARLRPCAVGGNAWQTFHNVADPNTDITGGVLIESTAGLALNDAAFGGNGSPVISFTPSLTGTAVNQIWLIP